MKLGAVVQRAKAAHGLQLSIADSVIDAISDRCREVESGARNVDHILRGSVLPLVSSEILRRMAADQELDHLHLGLGPGGEFELEWKPKS